MDVTRRKSFCSVVSENFWAPSFSISLLLKDRSVQGINERLIPFGIYARFVLNKTFVIYFLSLELKEKSNVMRKFGILTFLCFLKGNDKHIWICNSLSSNFPLKLHVWIFRFNITNYQVWYQMHLSKNLFLNSSL